MGEIDETEFESALTVRSWLTEKVNGVWKINQSTFCVHGGVVRLPL